MTLSYTEFVRTPANGKRQKFGLGGGLYGGIEPSKKGGGHYLYWRNRKHEKRLGTLPRINEKKARRKVLALQDWVAKGNHPKLFGKHSINKKHTFKYAVDHYVKTISADGKDIKEVTLRNYKNQLYNQALPRIGGETLLKDLEWKEGSKGRSFLLDMVNNLKEGRTGEQARKVLGVCRQVFEYAIDQDWMSKGTNPALHPKKWTQTKTHNPTISWAEVPKFLEDLNNNECKGFPETVLVVKFMLMSFLRASTVVCLQWDWIKEIEGHNYLEIPAGTAGLKRSERKIKEGTAKPHYVPLTVEMENLLDQIKNKTGWQKYIFHSPRGKKYPHICPDAPNKHLINLGYKGKLTAHGWRSVALTAGQDVLKFPHHIIQMQMGHILGDSVRQAYDNALLLEERKKFMDAWSDALVEKGLDI